MPKRKNKIDYRLHKGEGSGAQPSGKKADSIVIPLFIVYLHQKQSLFAIILLAKKREILLEKEVPLWLN